MAETPEQRERTSALIDLALHDLRNPIASIQLNVQLVGQEPALPADVAEALDDVQAAVGALQRLLANLADLLRATHAELPARALPTSAASLFGDVQHALESRATPRRQRVELEVPGDLPQLLVDPELLQRVLVTLGGDSLSCTPAGGRITLGARATQRGVELRLTDDGPKIPEAQRARVLELDYQLEGRVAGDPRAGRGFGLAFCQAAARAQGGRLWVEDAPGRGACWCLELPAVP